MKYAIIRSGSKQYQVKEGQSLEIEIMGTTEGQVIFDQVLLVVDEDKVEVGTPTVEGIKVYGTVVKEGKGDKIIVFKYKSKSRYRKLNGHRQSFALVKIESIGKEPVKVTSVKAEKKVVEKKTVVKKPTATKKVATPKKPATKKATK